MQCMSRLPAMGSADTVVTASCACVTGPVAALPPLVHSVTSAALLGPVLGSFFYPHTLHSFTHVCHAFSNWVQSSLMAHDRSARQVWQLARRRLVEEREAVVLARGALSEHEKADVDEQLNDAWDSFTYPDWHSDEPSTDWWIQDRPSLADATAHVARMRLLVARGARAQPAGQRQRSEGGLQLGIDARAVQPQSSCDCYHKLLLVDFMQRPQ